MPNICSNTPIKDEVIKGLRAELNFIRKSICSLQAGGGGGGNTIYTGDASVSGNRVIDLADHNLSIINGDEGGGISIESSAGNVNGIIIKTYFEEGAGNATYVQSSSDALSATSYMLAGFNDGQTRARIILVANVTEGTATYDADTHTFNGEIDYNGNGKLLADRTIDLDGHRLEFSSGGSNFFIFNPTAGNEDATIQVFDNTDDGNKTYISALAITTQAYFDLKSSFNDGVKTVQIFGTANNSTSSLSYTADTHTFNGLVSTNGGTNFYNWGAANDGGGPPGAADSTITVTIDGHIYSILAKLIS